MIPSSRTFVTVYIQPRSWRVAYISLLLFIIRAGRCPVVQRLLVRCSIPICGISTFTRVRALFWIEAPQPSDRPADPSLRVGIDPFKFLGRQECWPPPGCVASKETDVIVVGVVLRLRREGSCEVRYRTGQLFELLGERCQRGCPYGSLLCPSSARSTVNGFVLALVQDPWRHTCTDGVFAGGITQGRSGADTLGQATCNSTSLFILETG